MSSGSRIRTVLVLLGTILAAGPAAAEDGPGGKPREPSETKASGNWTDPPVRPEPAPTNAAAPRPVSTPAKIDEPTGPKRADHRSVRRSAKLRRQEIRKTASRAHAVRQARVSEPKTRRVAAARVPPRVAAPPRQAGGRMGGWRPVYGYIEPEAPAAAYYARRRFGTVGSGPGGLGLPSAMGPTYRIVRAEPEGPRVMRWRGPILPFGYTIAEPAPPDAFEDE
ncbi:MAG: hypothetical protein PGN25_04290 [Methylorubrum populi]